MSQMTDRELLSRYVARDDHDAFAELVHRHIGFVHSAARRQTHGDASLADDVAQAVMIVLARRAGSIAPGVPLPSWLFTVTRHAAQNAMKMRSRQRYHERRALASEARVERAVESPDESGADLRGVLDDAIARLPEPDRSGVVLHYLKQRSHAEVGAALGLSPDAARKRVERALDKMRTFLTGRGVVTSGAAIVAALHAEAASAAATVVPAQLVASTVNLIVLSGAGAGAGAGAVPASSGAGSFAIANGVTNMLTLAKLKVAAAVALLVTAVAGATVTPLIHRAAPQALVTTTSLAVSQQGAQADRRAPAAIEVGPDIKLEILGLSPFPGDEESWFSITGEPIDTPEVPAHEMRANAEPDYQMLIRVTGPKDAIIMPRIEGARIAMNARGQDGGGGGADGYVLTSRFSLDGPADTLAMSIGVSSGNWTPIAATDRPQEESDVDAGEYGAMTFAPAEPDPEGDGALVSVSHRRVQQPARAVAYDEAGQLHQSKRTNVRATNDEVVSSYTFDLPPEKIRKVEVQLREFDKFVEVKGISLTQGQKTEPTIKVIDAKKEK
jgi:RNA polymerase sigma factor (sigma-70 family)